MRPALVLALALIAAGVILAATPVEARIVQPEPPPAPALERGGRTVPEPGRAAPRCATPAGPELSALLAFEACLGMPTAEYLARWAALNRLVLETGRPVWRAPRLAAQRAREKRRARHAHR